MNKYIVFLISFSLCSPICAQDFCKGIKKIWELQEKNSFDTIKGQKISTRHGVTMSKSLINFDHSRCTIKEQKNNVNVINTFTCQYKSSGSYTKAVSKVRDLSEEIGICLTLPFVEEENQDINAKSKIFYSVGNRIFIIPNKNKYAI